MKLTKKLQHVICLPVTTMKPLRALLVAVASLAVVYATVLGLAIRAKPYLTFVPLRRLIANNFPAKRDVFLTCQGLRLHGWFVPGPSKKHVLFAHGCAGNVSCYQAQLDLFRELGCSVWLFDYPGFGISEGSPTEAGCHAAARAFYDEMRKVAAPEDIVLAGISLGGAVMGRLATQVPHSALVLIATFVNPRYLLQTFWRPLWLWSFVADHFNLDADLRTLAAKPNTRATVFHSKTDGLIDFCHAQRNAKTLRCPLVEVGGWHGDPDFGDDATAHLSTLIHCAHNTPETLKEGMQWT